MSMFSIVSMVSSGRGGWSTKRDERGADLLAGERHEHDGVLGSQAAIRASAISVAAPNNAATPEALSSARTCGTSIRGE